VITIPIDDTNKTNVISLCDARNKFKIDKCKHKHIEVDEELALVECADCGEKLNPVAMLLRFAHEESMWGRRCEELKKYLVELDARVRCKCQHCGRMTRIER